MGHTLIIFFSLGKRAKSERTHDGVACAGHFYPRSKPLTSTLWGARAGMLMVFFLRIEHSGFLFFLAFPFFYFFPQGKKK